MRMYAYIAIYTIVWNQGMEPVYTVYTVNTVYTMYHHNTRIKSTKIQALGTLKIPFDIVVDALFNRGYHPIQLLQKCRFL